ncbi:MAG: hypothetical protein HYT78_01060 [Deltaproteobacteria bacterium]|nr:hypothetical protein [Deltaproteobacteria bacterium]
MNVLNFPERQRPKATDVSPWYGVYDPDPRGRGVLGTEVLNTKQQSLGGQP